MTVPILKRGDIVHLAIPLSTAATPFLQKQQAAHDAQHLISEYSKQGVHVAFWSAGSLTPTATIVAIFREGNRA